jgi:hypothetical protein
VILVSINRNVGKETKKVDMLESDKAHMEDIALKY